MVGDMLTTLQTRIFHKVRLNEKGCWLWPTLRKKDGYGSITVDGKVYMAHRVAYEAFNGEIPAGLLVRHRCDVRACVHPDHLQVGTQQDNHDDRVARTLGRQVITDELAERIKQEYAAGGVTQYELADAYRTSQGTVSKIIRGVWH